MQLILLDTHTEETDPSSTAISTEVGCLIAGSTLLGAWLFIELIIANAARAFGWPGWVYPIGLALAVIVIGAGGVALARLLASRGVLGRPRTLLDPTATAEPGPPLQVTFTQFATRGTPVETVTLEAWHGGDLLGKQAKEGVFVPGGQALEVTFSLPLEETPDRLRVTVHLPERTLIHDFAYPQA